MRDVYFSVDEYYVFSIIFINPITCPRECCAELLRMIVKKSRKICTYLYIMAI